MATAPLTSPTVRFDLRREALSLLDGRGAILDTARELSAKIRGVVLTGMVIGGVAVFLHGHVRTTVDVDIFTPGPAANLGDLLLPNGFTHDLVRREFVRQGIPVHLFLAEQRRYEPKKVTEIDGITTVSLADRIEMKLSSGTTNLLWAQDLADVIGLSRHHMLGGDFARQLDKSLRAAVRKLTRAIASEN